MQAIVYSWDRNEIFKTVPAGVAFPVTCQGQIFDFIMGHNSGTKYLIKFQIQSVS